MTRSIDRAMAAKTKAKHYSAHNVATRVSFCA